MYTNGVSAIILVQKQAFGMEPKYFKCHMVKEKGNNQKKNQQ